MRGRGRPPGFDRETYKQRNTIERSFSRVKQWRGLATRYDKYAVTYLGGVLLGMVILTHRANHWQTRSSLGVSRLMGRHSP